MVYENLKKYGPYQGKDGRLRVILKDKDNKLKTVSYPKYLMEIHLDRYLTEEETVDHIDGNYLHNELGNLQILDRVIHTTLDSIRNADTQAICKYCGRAFSIKGESLHLRNRKDNNHSGYFCSKTCTGRYGRDIQLGNRQVEYTSIILAEKYRLK